MTARSTSLATREVRIAAQAEAKRTDIKSDIANSLPLFLAALTGD